MSDSSTQGLDKIIELFGRQGYLLPPCHWKVNDVIAQSPEEVMESWSKFFLKHFCAPPGDRLVAATLCIGQHQVVILRQRRGIERLIFQWIDTLPLPCPPVPKQFMAHLPPLQFGDSTTSVRVVGLGLSALLSLAHQRIIHTGRHSPDPIPPVTTPPAHPRTRSQAKHSEEELPTQPQRAPVTSALAELRIYNAYNTTKEKVATFHPPCYYGTAFRANVLPRRKKSLDFSINCVYKLYPHDTSTSLDRQLETIAEGLDYHSSSSDEEGVERRVRLAAHERLILNNLQAQAGRQCKSEETVCYSVGDLEPSPPKKRRRKKKRHHMPTIPDDEESSSSPIPMVAIKIEPKSDGEEADDEGEPTSNSPPPNKRQKDSPQIIVQNFVELTEREKDLAYGWGPDYDGEVNTRRPFPDKVWEKLPSIFCDRLAAIIHKVDRRYKTRSELSRSFYYTEVEQDIRRIFADEQMAAAKGLLPVDRVEYPNTFLWEMQLLREIQPATVVSLMERKWLNDDTIDLFFRLLNRVQHGEYKSRNDFGGPPYQAGDRIAMDPDVRIKCRSSIYLFPTTWINTILDTVKDPPPGDWERRLRQLQYDTIDSAEVRRQTRPLQPPGTGWKTLTEKIDGRFEARGARPKLNFGQKEWNYRCALMPINKGNFHWLTVVADFHEEILYLFDPMGLDTRYTKEYMHLLGIIGHRLNWRSGESDTRRQWDWAYQLLETGSIQVDNWNCGIFCILLAWHTLKLGRCPTVSELRKIRPSKDEFLHIRHWVLLSIFHDRVWLAKE